MGGTQLYHGILWEGQNGTIVLFCGRCNVQLGFSLIGVKLCNYGVCLLD